MKYRKISAIFLRNFAYRPAQTRYSSPIIGRLNFGNFSGTSPIGIYRSLYRFFGKFPDISYQSSLRTGYKICPFFFNKIRYYLVIWSLFAGKGCVFQPGSKIVDLGFVKFKSSGIKAKRPLEQIQKTQGVKKKQQFFWFSLGVSHGFSRKLNEDEFSRKSNGGWILLGIKRGLQK